MTRVLVYMYAGIETVIKQVNEADVENCAIDLRGKNRRLCFDSSAGLEILRIIEYSPRLFRQIALLYLMASMIHF